MGFIWEEFRAQFPVCKNIVYLNHAAVSPLSKPAADAMRALVANAEEFGSLHYDRWTAAYQGVREAAAALIHASPGEIAIVKNTSEGIATVAMGFGWRPGDRVVAFEGEFPANQYPWMRLAGRGVSVTWLQPEAPLAEIETAVKGARLLTISFVQFLSGYRADLQAIGEICRRHDCFFFVDAIQGLGALPLHVETCRIDALAADGHKWLTGPEGCGILYIRADRQDAIEPMEFGWTNVAGFGDYGKRDLTLRSGAGRYEPGTLNTAGCFGLRAAMEFLQAVGVARIEEAVLGRTGQIAAGAAAKGYKILGSREPEHRSGIVSFRRQDVDPRQLYRDLRDEGFMTALRAGWLRVSPHFYISPEDAAAFLEALP